MNLQEPTVICMVPQLQINGLKVGGLRSESKGTWLLKYILKLKLNGSEGVSWSAIYFFLWVGFYTQILNYSHKQTKKNIVTYTFFSCDAQLLQKI